MRNNGIHNEIYYNKFGIHNNTNSSYPVEPVLQDEKFFIRFGAYSTLKGCYNIIYTPFKDQSDVVLVIKLLGQIFLNYKELRELPEKNDALRMVNPILACAE